MTGTQRISIFQSRMSAYLPGHLVRIKNGQLFVDGVVISHMKGMQYTPDLHRFGQPWSDYEHIDMVSYGLANVIRDYIPTLKFKFRKFIMTTYRDRTH